MFKQIHFAIFPTEGLTRNIFRFNAISFTRRLTFQRNIWSMLNRHHPRSYLKISQCRTSRTYRITNNWPIENSHKQEISHRKNQIHFLYLRSCQLCSKCRKVGILLNFCWWFKDGTKGMSKQKHSCEEHLKFFKTLNRPWIILATKTLQGMPDSFGKYGHDPTSL